MMVLSRLVLGLLFAIPAGIAARAGDSQEKGVVCKRLHAKQAAAQIKTEEKAVSFTAPNGDGRRGAVGLLVSTKGKSGSRISFKFRRSASGYGFRVIHLLKKGHVLASVGTSAVTLYRGGSWVYIWGNSATSEKVITTKKASEVFPIQPDKDYEVTSELASSGRYRLLINGTLICEHQVKEARPLALETKDGPVWGGSEVPTLYGKFQGPEFEPKLKSGQAGVIVGPMDGSGITQRMDQITIATGIDAT